MSESNQVVLRYIPEVTYDTTPTNGVWETIRYTSESLSATPTTTTSSEIRTDRMTSDMPKVGLTVGGDVSFEFSAASFDDFIESAMCSTWQGDTPVLGSRQLKVGVVDSSYSIEKEYGDIVKFASFSGMRVGSMSLSMAYGEILTGSFTFAGAGAATSSTSLVGTGSTNAATTTPVVNASSDIGTVKIDGVTTDICINSLEITLDNALRETTCIGKDSPKDQKKGTASITGSVEMYLSAESFALYETALSNGSISLEYTISDGTNSYVFLVPNAKLSGEAPSSGGLDQDVMFSAEFTALYDPTENSSLVITATP
jgi:hypothetical protein